MSPRAGVGFAVRILLLWAVAFFTIGCGGGDRDLPLREWTFHGPAGPPRPVVLPLHLGPEELPRRDSVYVLETALTLPPAYRGVPLELSWPAFGGHADAEAAGRPLPPLEPPRAAYRPAGPQRFALDAAATAAGSLTLTLRVHHTWEQSAWLDSVPTLRPLGEPSPHLRRLELVTRQGAVGGLVALLQVGLTCLLVYATDRRRRAYLWFGVQGLSAATYPAFTLGWLTSLVGSLDLPVMEVGLLTALWTSVYFTHTFLALGRSPRVLDAFLGLSVAVSCVVVGPFDATRIAAPLVVLSVAAVIF